MGSNDIVFSILNKGRGVLGDKGKHQKFYFSEHSSYLRSIHFVALTVVVLIFFFKKDWFDFRDYCIILDIMIDLRAFYKELVFVHPPTHR